MSIKDWRFEVKEAFDAEKYIVFVGSAAQIKNFCKELSVPTGKEYLGFSTPLLLMYYSGAVIQFCLDGPAALRGFHRGWDRIVLGSGVTSEVRMRAEMYAAESYCCYVVDAA